MGPSLLLLFVSSEISLFLLDRLASLRSSPQNLRIVAGTTLVLYDLVNSYARKVERSTLSVVDFDGLRSRRLTVASLMPGKFKIARTMKAGQMFVRKERSSSPN